METHKLPDALVISCIDFRFHDKLREILKKEKVASFDLICLAGGAKNLASPLKIQHKETVIDNIGLAVKLHKVQYILLCNHIDCGAYLSAEASAQAGGGSVKFKNLKEEIKFHKTELENAKNTVKELFPALKIKTIILK